MKKNIKYLFCNVVLIGLILPSFLFAEEQCKIDIPKTSKKKVKIDINAIAECFENKYSIDKDAMRRSNRENPPSPEVQIYFNEANPMEGDKVTAVASPLNFKNSPENLYYTWYLVHTNEEGKPVDKNGKSIVDLNIPKMEAMSIAARGDFNAHLFGIDYNTVVDDDDDGMELPIGGLDGRGARAVPGYKIEGTAKICPRVFYFEDDDKYFLDKKKWIFDPDRTSGVFEHWYGNQDYVNRYSAFRNKVGLDIMQINVHKFANCYDENGRLLVDSSKLGDGFFGIDEESCWGTDPNNPDTDGDGILDEADVAGLAQKKFTWTYRKGDRVGVIVEGTSNRAINEGDETVERYPPESNPMTGYYKIMFAQPGICNFRAISNFDEVKKVNQEALFLNNDGCDYSLTFGSRSEISCKRRLINDGADSEVFCASAYRRDAYPCPIPDRDISDLGYQYAKAIPVNESSTEIPKIVLNYSPKNPQFFDEDDEQILNDRIKINATIQNEAYNQDYLHYTWELYKCDDGNFDSCKEEISTDSLQSKSYFQGQGIDFLEFEFKKDFIKNELTLNKEYIKAVLVVQRFKGDVKKGIKSVLIPILKNPVKITLKGTSFNESDGVWSVGDEICNSGVSSNLCPVYPGQVIYAEADVDPDRDINCFAWKLNDEIIESPEKCLFSGEHNCIGDSKRKGVYIPIKNLKGTFDLEVLAGTCDSYNGDSEGVLNSRILSIGTVKTAIETDLEEVQSSIYNVSEGLGADINASLSDSIFPQKIPVEWSLEENGKVSSSNGDFVCSWFLNNTKVDDMYLNINPDMDVSFPNPKSISFKANVFNNEDIGLSTRVSRIFSDKYKKSFFDAWGISLTPVSGRYDVLLRIPSNQEEEGFVSVDKFLASGIKNAGEYFVYIVRMVVALMMSLFLLRGVVFLKSDKF